MHDWFYQIELIESIWQKKAEIRELHCLFQIAYWPIIHFETPQTSE